jgi:hypothetical protein
LLDELTFLKENFSLFQSLKIENVKSMASNVNTAIATRFKSTLISQQTSCTDFLVKNKYLILSIKEIKNLNLTYIY